MIYLTIVFGLAAAVLPVLTYFAGVKRGKDDRAADAMETRISRVADNFSATDPMRRNINLAEFIRAGAPTLHDFAEVVEAADRIEKRGASHPIPRQIQEQIPKEDWLHFLRWCSANNKPKLADIGNPEEIAKFIDKYKASKNA